MNLPRGAAGAEIGTDAAAGVPCPDRRGMAGALQR
jgi:hypothetical protein